MAARPTLSSITACSSSVSTLETQSGPNSSSNSSRLILQTHITANPLPTGRKPVLILEDLRIRSVLPNKIAQLSLQDSDLCMSSAENESQVGTSKVDGTSDGRHAAAGQSSRSSQLGRRASSSTP
eukprot:764379-Hanusia_phi.AAC.4